MLAPHPLPSKDKINDDKLRVFGPGVFLYQNRVIQLGGQRHDAITQ